MITFEKWEGLGNDFIVIDQALIVGDLTDKAVSRLCDRHTGIGADGVLLVDRTGAAPSMIVRNADGSRPEMCGNGLRCVAGFLSGGAPQTTLTIRTDAGDLEADVATVSAGVVRVEAAMGMGRATGTISVPIEGKEHPFDTINVGNPHAVTFERYDDASIDRIAPLVERFVSGGTNVEFVRLVDGQHRVRVWERGVGYTQACGTGAVAVAVAACLSGRAAFDQWQDIGLPGGPLGVRIEQGTLRARMRGPARRVFRGDLTRDTLD